MIKNIEVLREELTLPAEEGDENETWTYLTIYDQDKNILLRSGAYPFENFISLDYNNLTFVSNLNQEVAITLESLNNFINEKV